ncbi:hypothetical protein CFELI_08040 [Corynebacterium felinum]|uniref:Transposase n=1 Tax=Corynebacterium felinum TaxID=131318 RepID=A0ABU2BC65_9CORY|nr:hypothetical protein [Corynebacterium felinum]WJY95214.1 hypothetical protein CFELI_08040 [Corynebacterium felinum]
MTETSWSQLEIFPLTWGKLSPFLTDNECVRFTILLIQLNIFPPCTAEKIFHTRTGSGTLHFRRPASGGVAIVH